MNYYSLYRKYRPATFDDIVEQQHIVRILTKQVISGNIAHAYLFSGTRGTGKTTIARIFAKAINCENPQNGSPCGKCAACIALSGTNSDIYEIDAASNNGVDDVRALKDGVQYSPLQVKRKVYIIDEVHQFSPNAFNALLKTLEEPPEYCVFILATTEPQKLPQTILSRCLKLDFRLISTDSLAKQISHILTSEGVNFTPEAADAIAAAGEGSSRDAISVAEACIGNTKDILDYYTVLNVLGANNPEVIADTCMHILSSDVSGALAQVEFCCNSGKSIAVFARDIAKYLRNLLIIKSSPNGIDFLHLPATIAKKAKDIAASFGGATILKCLEIFSSLDATMRYSLSPRYVVEMAIAKCSALTAQSEIDIKARLESLEKAFSGGITVTKYINEVRLINATTAESPSAIPDISPLTTDEQQDLPAPVQSIPFDGALDGLDGLSPLSSPVDEIPFETESAQPTAQTGKEDVSSAQKTTAKVKNKAKAVQYKGFLLTKTRENNLMMLNSIINDDNTLINVYTSSVEIIVKHKFSLSSLENSREILTQYTDEFFGAGIKLLFKLIDDKRPSDNTGLKNMFDPKKVKVIK